MAETETTEQMTQTTGQETGTSEKGNESQTQQQSAQSTMTTEALDKLIQSRVDKSTAELGKKIASLQKENEKLKKENMSAEEIKQLEISEREKALTEKEQALLDRENRLYALKALTKEGLNDGSDESFDLVDLVMSTDTDEIDKKVKSFSKILNAKVKAEVDKVFKENGRQPNKGNVGTENKENKSESIATKLGKNAAEMNKQSQEVLSHYIK